MYYAIRWVAMLKNLQHGTYHPILAVFIEQYSMRIKLGALLPTLRQIMDPNVNNYQCHASGRLQAEQGV